MIYKFRLVREDPWVKKLKYRGSKDSIGPSIDKHGRPNTGLTCDTEGKDDKGRTVKIPGTEKLFEQKLNLKPGELAPNSKYWDMFCIKVDGKVMELNSDDPLEDLYINFLKAQPQVAVGIDDLNVNANAIYVLYVEEEVVKKENERGRARRKANAAFENLTLEQRSDMLYAYGFDPTTLTEDGVEAKLGDLMESDYNKFMSFIDNKLLKYTVLLRKFLNKNIVSITHEGVVMHGENILGYSITQAAEKLAEDKTFTEQLKLELK